MLIVIRIAYELLFSPNIILKFVIGIIFLLVVVSGLSPVFGPPYFSPQQRYDGAEIIFTGKILSYEKPPPPENQLSSVDTIYNIEVDQYIKNPQPEKTLSVIARGSPDAEINSRGYDTVNFDVGDFVYVYLQKHDRDTMYRIQTLFSHKIDSSCDEIPQSLSRLVTPPSEWEVQSTDKDGNKKHSFKTGEEVIIQYDVVNKETFTQTFSLSMTVYGPDNDDDIFSESVKKEITLPACRGHAIAEWTFVPSEMGMFFIKISDGNGNTGFGIDVNEKGIVSNPDRPVNIPASVLQQHRAGVERDNLVCHGIPEKFLVIKKNGDPACVNLETVYKLIERGWAAKESTDSSQPAFAAAHRFLENSPTFRYDGIRVGSGFSSLSHAETFPPTYLLHGHFRTENQGYGDRTGQNVENIEASHDIIVKVRGTEVVYAVIDNVWDEIDQKLLYQRSENSKDFEVRYQKYFAGEEGYHIKIESRPGLLRVSDTPNDVHYLLSPQEVDDLWSVLTENYFTTLQTPRLECNTCVGHELQIQSGGTYKNLSWSDNAEISKEIQLILDELKDITSLRNDGWVVN